MAALAKGLHAAWARSSLVIWLQQAQQPSMGMVGTRQHVTYFGGMRADCDLLLCGSCGSYG
jgi:hypothetical protein